MNMSLEDLVVKAREFGGSDIHLACMMTAKHMRRKWQEKCMSRWKTSVNSTWRRRSPVPVSV